MSDLKFPPELYSKHEYSSVYKDTVFLVWWRSNKPALIKLQAIIPPDPDTGRKPNIHTLSVWRTDYFIPKAATMDEEFYDQITAVAIQEKVEMLQRHSAMSVKMQRLAEDYIVEHEEDLTINSAIRLLIEGVRIERESKGIPDALQKMSDMSDDELLEEVKAILSESSGDLMSNAEED